MIFDGQIDKFKENDIDGYTLLCLTEEDMVESLGMENERLRQHL